MTRQNAENTSSRESRSDRRPTPEPLLPPSLSSRKPTLAFLLLLAVSMIAGVLAFAVRIPAYVEGLALVGRYQGQSQLISRWASVTLVQDGTDGDRLLLFLPSPPQGSFRFGQELDIHVRGSQQRIRATLEEIQGSSQLSGSTLPDDAAQAIADHRVLVVARMVVPRERLRAAESLGSVPVRVRVGSKPAFAVLRERTAQ